jgi:predicted GH43/DUF377 family glycosyl hydrolase
MEFKWKKYGLIFNDSMLPNWAKNSALTPTPIQISNDIIRIYCGFRDKDGVSRIGYVDLSAYDPSKVIAVSQEPVLDVGRSGCFDDNGVILGDVIKDDSGKYRMYYVGFQLVKNVKFLAFSGLAISQDGEHFKRVSEVPILDRAKGATTIRAIHSVIKDSNEWRIWYAVGSDWQDINGVDYPKYNIWHTTSKDGIEFSNSGQLCVDVAADEYRIGRPSVYKIDEGYMMFYTKGGVGGEDYFPGVAFSRDGIKWERDDSKLNLALGLQSQFDSEHLCYPRLFEVNDRRWIVYNGNNMGQEGFGLAELIR